MNLIFSELFHTLTEFSTFPIKVITICMKDSYRDNKYLLPLSLIHVFNLSNKIHNSCWLYWHFWHAWMYLVINRNLAFFKSSSILTIKILCSLLPCSNHVSIQLWMCLIVTFLCLDRKKKLPIQK